jgi:hypothetical protein
VVLGKIIEGKMISFGDEFCLGRGACPVCPACIEGKRHRIRPDLTNGGQGSVVADGYAETPRPPLPLLGDDRQECLSHGAIGDFFVGKIDFRTIFRANGAKWGRILDLIRGLSGCE